MPANIQKIAKKHVIKKPEPSIATHSHLSKSWTTPIPKIQGHKNLLFGYHGVYCFARLALSRVY